MPDIAAAGSAERPDLAYAEGWEVVVVHEALGLDDAQVIYELLIPYPAEEMATHPVSTLVNSPANDRPECIAPK